MNKIKMIAAMFIAGILLTFVSCGDNGKSKKISIAYANWSEGIAMTNLAKAIFEDQGYYRICIPAEVGELLICVKMVISKDDIVQFIFFDDSF